MYGVNIMDKQVFMQEQGIERLRHSAQCVLDLYDELVELKDPRKDQRAMSLFRAVATLSLELAQPGMKLQDIRFTPRELFKKAIELGFTKESIKETPSDWVRKNWKTLEKEIIDRTGHLQDLSQRKKLEYFPWIAKEESIGGQGRHSYYYLVSKPLNEAEKIESKFYDIPAGGVHYVPELSDVPIWARWVNGFVLKGWQKYIFLSPAMVVTLFASIAFSVLITQGIYGKISTVSWLSQWLVIIALVVWAFSSPLFRVVSNRIVMAPDWMTRLKDTNVQLELKKIDTDPETGKVTRELRLMVYSAKCPVCTGRVEVVGGGIEFPFRLVGRCTESPREHVFSFDHITRTGKLLRMS